jgi:GNAT superfamily N-acetyltransferase
MHISNTLEIGDLGEIVKQHGLLYGKEYGYDCTFEAYVAEPLAQFVKRQSPRERMWLAKIEGELVGSICICELSETDAQLRWFSVTPKARGQGLGKALMEKALAYCTEKGYTNIVLWTVKGLAASTALYLKHGFHVTQEIERELWGKVQLEQCYEKSIG